jgi:hypothetical protein
VSILLSRAEENDNEDIREEGQPEASSVQVDCMQGSAIKFCFLPCTQNMPVAKRTPTASREVQYRSRLNELPKQAAIEVLKPATHGLPCFKRSVLKVRGRSRNTVKLHSIENSQVLAGRYRL